MYVLLFTIHNIETLKVLLCNFGVLVFRRFLDACFPCLYKRELLWNYSDDIRDLLIESVAKLLAKALPVPLVETPVKQRAGTITAQE